MSREITESNGEKLFIVFLRLCMGWTFLYAGIHHFGDDKFVLGFLSHVKTFHAIFGLLVRVSAPFGIMLMLLYWTAHMDFPYIENANNFLIDYHIVFAGILCYLIAKRAGHVFGLDGLIERWHVVESYPALRPLVG